MLNRSALIVRPEQPFIDWALSLDDSGLAPESDDEQTVYLLPEWEDDKDKEKLLRLVYAEIFERELENWWTEESAWPQQRTLKMFKQWFKIEMHSIVEDICGYPIADDEM